MTKDSQNKDIGSISTDFPSIRLKYGVKRRKNKVSELDDDEFRVSLDMIEPWKGKLNTVKPSDASTGLVKFREGDVLLSKLRPYLAKAFIADQEGAGSPELIVLEPKEFDPRYLLYLLLSTEMVDRIDASTTGASLPRASWRFIGDLEVPNPPKETQKKIVSYLDQRTEEIDQIISVCKQVINKIALWKEAIQIEDLIKGENWNAFDIHTFSEQIPEGWNATKLKWISKVIDTKHRTAEYIDSGIPIISPSEVSENGIDIKNANRTTKEEYNDLIEDGRKPRPGDIIYSRNASVGDAALVRSNEQMCMGQDLCIIRSDIGEYLYHVLNSPIVKSQVEALTVGATFDRINVSDIKDIIIPLPPDDKIDTIAQNLAQNRELAQNSTARLESLIKLLNERRRVTISRAVTGKMNICYQSSSDILSFP